MKKRSSSPQALLERKLWQLCRQIADELWSLPDKTARCYTCDRSISGSNKQLGHFIPKAACGAYLKYDMRNLRWQCYNCNINLGSNGAVFYKKLVAEMGQEYVDRIFQDKQRVTKAIDKYQQLFELYTGILKDGLTRDYLHEIIIIA